MFLAIISRRTARNCAKLTAHAGRLEMSMDCDRAGISKLAKTANIGVNILSSQKKSLRSRVLAALALRLDGE